MFELWCFCRIPKVTIYIITCSQRVYWGLRKRSGWVDWFYWNFSVSSASYRLHSAELIGLSYAVFMQQLDLAWEFTGRVVIEDFGHILLSYTVFGIRVQISLPITLRKMHFIPNYNAVSFALCCNISMLCSIRKIIIAMLKLEPSTVRKLEKE